jgi:hypothetical protein
MRKLVAVAVVLGALAALGLGATIAFAQGPTPTPPAPGFGPMHGGFGMMGGFGFGADWSTKMQDAVAKALGLTLDQLNAELRAGKTIAQIAQSKEISLTKLHDDVLAAHKALIQQAVKDGTLRVTQAQADWMIQHMDAMDAYFDANGGACPGWTGAAGFGPGMMGGYGARVAPGNLRGGMMGGFQPNAGFRGGMMGGWFRR